MTVARWVLLVLAFLCTVLSASLVIVAVEVALIHLYVILAIYLQGIGIALYLWSSKPRN